MNNFGPNIIVLTVPMMSPVLGPTLIYPVLLKDDDGLTLIDTGMFGQYDSLIQAIEQAGENLSSIKRIILTHQDIDHIGNLPVLVRELPGVQLFAHPGDIPVISGRQTMLKMTPERISKMPPVFQEQINAFLSQLAQLGKITELHDGQQLPWGGGAEVIHTPGHTPGHICLYLPQEKLLLAADELRVVEGKLAGPAESATPDMPLALRSLHKLEGLAVQSILCYHGGYYDGSPQELIAELTAGL
ncbi:MBL fold metallo-hydrolase [Paenibacillus sp. MMS20-IR301]|uniref:MBL fold metallo-hydrolase n=1 Tax=Paenibacillus sp. MMS20-IR301 TaxID=2895946 RepID=UPI0028E9830E|nr:MBL fold metallo-hydrolase [Paenibacillus sp. MMS20-IR301]WNS40977.1 MBL fold metallo-hydrolase [Paenibacillus sp. MMS20-IR301]